MADDHFFDKDKLLRMIRTTLNAADKMPESHYKDAIAGGLEAILEEAEKPLPISTSTLH